MAKKEDLKNGFLKRIENGSPSPKTDQSPGNVEREIGEHTISAQERERRSRSGRKRVGDTSARLTDSYEYTSLALDVNLYEKIREIGKRNGLPYRDIVNAALRKYIELYEDKNGPVTVSGEAKISAESLI